MLFSYRLVGVVNSCNRTGIKISRQSASMVCTKPKVRIQHCTSWVLWRASESPALRRWRQDDLEVQGLSQVHSYSEASLGCMMSFSQGYSLLPQEIMFCFNRKEGREDESLPPSELLSNAKAPYLEGHILRGEVKEGSSRVLCSPVKTTSGGGDDSCHTTAMPPL